MPHRHYLNMKEQRIVIADRSALAHNLYKIFLHPLGLKCSSYQTMRDLKENGMTPKQCRAFLINSNIFGNHFDYHWEWLRKNSSWKTVPKIFLCGHGEKKMERLLKTLPQSHLLTKPFSPDTLESILKRILGRKK